MTQSRKSPAKFLLATLVLVFASLAAFAQAPAFRVTSVQPSTINPTKGEVAQVSYAVPTTANYRIYVRNSAGAAVRNIADYRGIPASTRYCSWNGRSSSNAVLPNGVYTVVIEGTTSGGSVIAPGTGSVTVSTGATPPPPPPPPPPSTSAFVVTSVVPATFDPSKAETSKVTYTVPATANYRVYVRNSAGVEVRGLVQYVNVSASSMNRIWDGKATSGQVVPNGVYTFVIEGKTTTGVNITTGTGAVTVQAGVTPPPPPPPPPADGPFAISGISPSTIDPSQGQSAVVSYSVPVTANYRVVVRSGSTDVRVLKQVTAEAAGTKTVSWDGKNTAGSIVANGQYSVTVEGTNAAGAALTSATKTVTVNVGVTPPPPPPPPPPAGSELGQLIEGQGSANFAWLKYAGDKLGVAFVAPKSATLKTITLQWKSSSSGYGQSTDGSYGIFTFEIQTNNPATNQPSGTVIGSTAGMKRNDGTAGYSDGAFTLNMNATLTAGQIYHLVIYNTHPSPGSNWSSPNGLMTRVQPWDGTGCRAEVYENGSWKPWCSQDNPFNTGKTNYVNGEHIPLMLKYTDNTIYGDPYYSSAISGGSYFYGSYKGGQLMVWDKPTVTISRVGISVGKLGSPGALIYHLEQVGGSELASGTIATASQVNSLPTWVYAALPKAITLTQGQTYRLWFESPSSSSQSNCYYQYTPYGEHRPMEWLDCSWGGVKSTFTDNKSGSWATYDNFDFTFSMQ